jgi:hypothetical protein
MAQVNKVFLLLFVHKKKRLLSLLELLASGDVAQLVEHLLCKQGVVGSIPSISTSWCCQSAASGGAIDVRSFMGKIEFRFSLGSVPAKVSTDGARMFVPSFNVEEQNVLCQGE